MIDFRQVASLFIANNEVSELWLNGSKVWEKGSSAPSLLTFAAEEANSTVAMTAVGSAPSLSLEYSTDGGTTWSDFHVGSTTITLANVGDEVCIRAGSGGNERISSGSSTYNAFTTSGDLKVFGDITRLLSQSGNVTTLSSSQGDCFDSVFRGSTIVDAEGLILPVTTTNAAGVYSCMFRDCTSLVKPPAEIPDIQLNSTWTFNQMFQGCTSLTHTPKMLITSTNQQSSTFRNMFDGCTSLVDVDFDALTTASGEYCMGYAFQGCTSLETVEFPALDYIGYGNYGWRGAFSGCSALTSAKFPKLREVINSRTMYGMFDNCTGLETVDMGEIQTIQSYQTSDWMYSHCRSLVMIDFSKATAVPNLSNVNAFNDTNSTFRIVVPDALYDQWVAANNWSQFASQIVKASDYVPAA